MVVEKEANPNFFKESNLAQSVNAKFAFRGVTTFMLHKMKPWNLKMSQGEAIAIHGSPMELVLNWIQNLNSKLVTILEQELTITKQSLWIDLRKLWPCSVRWMLLQLNRRNL
ncbi:hypothetical protein M9H77_18709 [Catharanthus roseus]|uniref:Uncharacterized protein n=1 Tax=Catharanthus roseus TaxID=4058 RepID=A0ACC0B880_CATRO|nr:hypothetical protein M9H77_18709 [Catharanthus roseus]